MGHVCNSTRCLLNQKQGGEVWTGVGLEPKFPLPLAHSTNAFQTVQLEAEEQMVDRSHCCSSHCGSNLCDALSVFWAKFFPLCMVVTIPVIFFVLPSAQVLGHQQLVSLKFHRLDVWHDGFVAQESKSFVSALEWFTAILDKTPVIHGKKEWFFAVCVKYRTS